MVQQLRFELLFTERKELGVDFSLCLGLRVPVQYEFLGGRFANSICLWLMIQVPVTSLNKGHADS